LSLATTADRRALSYTAITREAEEDWGNKRWR